MRVCNDCDQRISDDGTCSCEATHPFRKGAKVTLCSDELGHWPIALAIVGKLGNGAFRLEGSKSWYDLRGKPIKGAGGTGFVRARREGDEEEIAEAERAQERKQKIIMLKTELEKERSVAADLWKREFCSRSGADGAARRAAAIDIAAIGEDARKKGVAAAVAKIEELRRAADAIDPEKVGEEWRKQHSEQAEVKAAMYRKDSEVKAAEAARLGSLATSAEARIADMERQVAALCQEDIVTYVMER